MAKTTVTLIKDDIDGSEDAVTIEFSYKGLAYTIDLAEKNEKKFDKAIDPFIAKATKVRGRRQRPAAPTKRSAGTNDLNEIRAWARANGHKVSDRGRISKAVQDAFAARK